MVSLFRRSDLRSYLLRRYSLQSNLLQRLTPVLTGVSTGYIARALCACPRAKDPVCVYLTCRKAGFSLKLTPERKTIRKIGRLLKN